MSTPKVCLWPRLLGLPPSAVLGVAAAAVAVVVVLPPAPETGGMGEAAGWCALAGVDSAGALFDAAEAGVGDAMAVGWVGVRVGAHEIECAYITGIGSIGRSKPFILGVLLVGMYKFDQNIRIGWSFVCGWLRVASLWAAHAAHGPNGCLALDRAACSGKASPSIQGWAGRTRQAGIP